MRSIILSIGDEVLIGQVINSNAAYLGKELLALGMPVQRIVTLPDSEEAILKEFRDAFKNYDVIAVTGGLGPTHDDITMKCVARFFKSKFVLNEKVLQHVKSVFHRRGIEMPAVNIGQALVPEGAVVLENKTGTAPGVLLDKKGKVFCVMPGVPYEMKYICTTGFFPYLQKKYRKRVRRVIKNKTLHTIGIGESLLAEKLGDIGKIVRSGKDFEVKLAFLPSNYEVRLRITASAKSAVKTDKLIEDTAAFIKKKAGRYVYSDMEGSIEKTVGAILKRKKLTISAAESCTGGLLTSKLTDIPGSSAYVMDSVVSYSDSAKIRLLGVNAATIKKFGAVSEECAVEMAKGIRQRSKTDIGISVTGIAGPGGARPQKPVGLVWIGYSDKKRSFAKKFIFTKDRLRNKDIMAKMALEIVRQQLIMGN